jgi:hypothetical protein
MWFHHLLHVNERLCVQIQRTLLAQACWLKKLLEKIDIPNLPTFMLIWSHISIEFGFIEVFSAIGPSLSFRTWFHPHIFFLLICDGVLSPPPCLRFLPFHHHTLHIFLFSNHFYPHLLQNLTSYELLRLQQLKYHLPNNPTTLNILNTSLASSPQILHFYVLFASSASYTSSSPTFILLPHHYLHCMCVFIVVE